MTSFTIFGRGAMAQAINMAVGPSSAGTTQHIGGDDQEAKETLAGAIRAGGLKAFDVGSLARARELEALGFLQLLMAASEQVPWTGGFAVVD